MASDLTRAVDVARCEAVLNYPLGSRTLEAVQNNPGYLPTCTRLFSDSTNGYETEAPMCRQFLSVYAQ